MYCHLFFSLLFSLVLLNVGCIVRLCNAEQVNAKRFEHFLGQLEETWVHAFVRDWDARGHLHPPRRGNLTFPKTPRVRAMEIYLTGRGTRVRECSWEFRCPVSCRPSFIATLETEKLIPCAVRATEKGSNSLATNYDPFREHFC